MAKAVMPCSDEVFVVAWQKARTLGDVAKVCGYPTANGPNIANHRARRLRARGVPLKTFRERDSEKLAWLAKRAVSGAE